MSYDPKSAYIEDMISEQTKPLQDEIAELKRALAEIRLMLFKHINTPHNNNY